jgi:C-terminal processing protease CtpA/Prc
VHKIERLAGNVGYLDVRVLHAASVAGETVVAAMNFLSNASALIIDLRQCLGGEPNTVALAISYLYNSEPVHLNSLYLRREDSTQQFWTAAYVPGKRLAGTPVYVLTSSSTFSGGEEFAYDLKSRKRATLVGETTRGGAHPGTPYRLNAHFEIFIPNGRAINPITGADWEGTGVRPDIAVPAEQAFTVAYRMALEAIITSLGNSSSKPHQELAEEARTALNTL